MRLATIREGDGTRAVRIDGDEIVDLGAPDVGAVLRRPDWLPWAAGAEGRRDPLIGCEYAPLVTAPDKIVCVGLNYKSHIAETGATTPAFPTLFAKYRGALVGACDDIVLPDESESSAVDYEAELAVIVGRAVRRATREEAAAAIAGFAVLNDVSVRDWQRRTEQWLQGKTWERSTPLGPWLVTADESPGPSRRITCEVSGDLLQDGNTDDLLFSPAEVVAYLSTFITLEPGDVIATGTPAGVGAARTPPRFLADGDVVVTAIEGLGEQRNHCRRG
ncbi:MAG TPA: fumarylacetoacetate hydrolase family protein [Acidimicrobiales bacterium]|nr:fumarylacetoacetate hydrolase family protein [Acidimicrobiales bacterium]